MRCACCSSHFQVTVHKTVQNNTAAIVWRVYLCECVMLCVLCNEYKSTFLRIAPVDPNWFENVNAFILICYLFSTNLLLLFKYIFNTSNMNVLYQIVFVVLLPFIYLLFIYLYWSLVLSNFVKEECLYTTIDTILWCCLTKYTHW